jgi:hypothetical protein
LAAQIPEIQTSFSQVYFSNWNKRSSNKILLQKRLELELHVLYIDIQWKLAHSWLVTLHVFRIKSINFFNTLSFFYTGKPALATTCI